MACSPTPASQGPAHVYVALQARDKLLEDPSTQDLGSLLVQQNNAYVAGASAPDIATAAYLILEYMDAYHPGWEAHHRLTGDIVLDLLARAQTLKKPEKRDELTAFALGWLTHCSTDWVIHPLVNEFGGYYGAPKEVRGAYQKRHKHLELVECEHVYHHATEGQGKRLLAAIPYADSVPIDSINATFYDLFKLYDCSPTSRTVREQMGKSGLTDFEEGMANSSMLMEKCCKWFAKVHQGLNPFGFPFKQVLKGFPPTTEQYRMLMDPLAVDDVEIERKGANSKLTIHYTINDFHLFRLFCDKWSRDIPRAVDNSVALLSQYAKDPKSLKVPNRDLDTGGPEKQGFDITKAYPGNPVITHLLSFVSIRNENGEDLSPWPKDGKWVWVGSAVQEDAFRKSKQDRVPSPTPEQGHDWSESKGFNGYYSGKGKFEVPFDDRDSSGLEVGIRLAFADQSSANEKKVYGWPEQHLSTDNYWSWTGAPPTDVVLLIDRSGNMPLEDLKRRSIDVTDRIRELSGGARVGVLSYSSLSSAPASDSINEALRVEQDLTSDLEAVNQALQRLSAGGAQPAPPTSRALPGAAYAQSLSDALQPRPVLAAVTKALQQDWQGRFKIIILIADAQSRPDPRDPTPLQQTAWTALKLDPVDVHTVLVGRNADPKAAAAVPFANLSTLCRGRVYAAKRAEDVTDCVREAAESAISANFRAPVDTTKLPALPTVMAGGGGTGGGPLLPSPSAAPPPRRSMLVPALAVLVLCLVLVAGVALAMARRQPLTPRAWLLPSTQGQPAIPLTRAAVTVGRGAAATVRLLDEQASALHASLNWSPAGYVLTDHGSTNGTRVNGRPIGAPTLLKPGDVIRIGHTELRLTDRPG